MRVHRAFETSKQNRNMQHNVYIKPAPLISISGEEKLFVFHKYR